MDEMDKKTKALIKAANEMLEACHVHGREGARITSLREAVQAFDDDETRTILGEIQTAMINKALSAYFLNCNDWDRQRRALQSAIDAWNELRRKGDGDE